MPETAKWTEEAEETTESGEAPPSEPTTLEEVVTPPELLRLPKDRLLPREFLKAGRATQRGIPIKIDRDGRFATPLLIPQLLDNEYAVPIGDLDTVVIANPFQPREDWDDDELLKLAISISRDGQQQATVVVPILDGRQVKLFIIDGESRKRAIQLANRIPFLRVVVRWAKDEEMLLRMSVILNEARKRLNPIELGRSYKRLLQYKTARGMNKNDAIRELAGELKIEEAQIYNFLQILGMHKSVHQLVIAGKLPARGARFVQQVTASLKGNEALMRQAEVARILLDSPVEDFRRRGVGAGRALTRDAVEAALTKIMVDGGDPEKARELRGQQAVYRFQAAMSAAKTNTAKFLEQDEAAVIAFLRERTQKSRGSRPPEVLRDAIVAVTEELRLALTRIEKAIAPDMIPEVPGKPRFTDFIRRQKAAFGNDARHRMAVYLASLADQDSTKILTVTELAEALQINSETITSNIPLLTRELAEIGILLDSSWPKRKKDTREKYHPIAAYRLRWLTAEGMPAMEAKKTAAREAAAREAAAKKATGEEAARKEAAAQEKASQKIEPTRATVETSAAGTTKKAKPPTFTEIAERTAAERVRTQQDKIGLGDQIRERIMRQRGAAIRKAAAQTPAHNPHDIAPPETALPSHEPLRAPGATRKTAEAAPRRIRDYVVGAAPNILEGAGKAAGQIAKILSESPLEVHAGTHYGNSVAVEIASAGPARFVLRSNLQGFKANYGGSLGNPLRQLIRNAYGNPDIRVDILDL